MALALLSAALSLPPVAVPLLLPDPQNKNKLLLQPEGLKRLSDLQGPVTVVSAIGQYRSGKSFLLNQLMELPCDAGFQVGHQRETQTKGVWVHVRDTSWSSPNVTTVFLDTEGFEGTGKAAVYDDRIFAFSALVASVLVYNLVETIREADIDKLSFAAQLAEEFWRRASTGGEEEARETVKASRQVDWRPPAMLWLVQRDFLQGGSVDEYLKEALKPVAASANDEHATRLNTIRQVLSKFTRMRGLGLPQPHEKRTGLCELEVHKLSAEYRAGMARVQHWVALNAPGRGAPRWLGGGEIALSIRQVVDALNVHDIPTATDVIDSFNRDVREKALEQLQVALRALPLPLQTDALSSAVEVAVAAAASSLHRRSFGAEVARMDKQFEEQAQPAVRAATDANFRASHQVCAVLWKKCAHTLASVKTASLPSRRRFHARLGSCNATMAACVGPAEAGYKTLLAQAASEGQVEYGEQFYSRLSHMLVLVCAVGVLTFRYIYQNGLAELLCWLVLIGAEVLPRLTAMTQFTEGLMPASTFWESPNGQKLVNFYEVAVYNEYADAEDYLYIGACVLLALLAWRFVCVCRQRCCGSKKKRRQYNRVRRRMGEEDDYDEDEDVYDDEDEDMVRTRTPPSAGSARTPRSHRRP